MKMPVPKGPTPANLQPGQRVGGHGADHDGAGGGEHRDEEAVLGPGEEPGLPDEVPVVLERGALADQERHRVAVVQLAVRLQRRERHVIEGEQGEDQEWQEAEMQQDLRPERAPPDRHQYACRRTNRSWTHTTSASTGKR